MRTQRMLCIGLFWVVGVWAADESSTYPLKPAAETERDGARAGYAIVTLGKDGEGEMPFATASGKLRIRKSSGKLLVCWDSDGKFTEAGKDAEREFDAKIPTKLAGKAFEYPLSLSVMNPQQLYIMGSVYGEAQVGQTMVRLYDSNVNGHLGEPEDSLRIGTESRLRAVTKYVAVEGKIHELQIVNDGEAIKLLPYTGPTATLKLNCKEGCNPEMKLVHVEGLFVALAKRTDVLLIPGAYGFEWGQVQFGEKTTANGRDSYPICLSSSDNKVGPFQIKEGQNSLTFGPPFKLDFMAGRSIEDAGEVAITDVFLIGSGGEQYRADNSGSNRSTLTCLVRSAGKEQEVAKLSYG